MWITSRRGGGQPTRRVQRISHDNGSPPGTPQVPPTECSCVPWPTSMRCHGHRGDRAMQRLARADAGHGLGRSPDAIRCRLRADTLAGARETDPPRRGLVAVTDDAQADLGARVVDAERVAMAARRAHAISRSRKRGDDRTHTSFAGCVAPESVRSRFSPPRGRVGDPRRCASARGEGGSLA